MLAEEQFCSSDIQDSVLAMMEKCFRPNGLFPGPGFKKTKEEIHDWAVRTAYDFCVVGLLAFSSTTSANRRVISSQSTRPMGVFTHLLV